MRYTSILACMALFLAQSALPQEAMTSDPEARKVAEQAYLFAYPMVLMELTRRNMTLDGSSELLNRFNHTPQFPDDRFRQVIRPNADTLYSRAWLDLSKEPVLLHVPDTKGRYYIMQFMDAWSETLTSPGKRTTGTADAWFALPRPDSTDHLPTHD